MGEMDEFKERLAKNIALHLVYQQNKMFNSVLSTELNTCNVFGWDSVTGDPADTIRKANDYLAGYTDAMKDICQSIGIDIGDVGKYYLSLLEKEEQQ